MALWFIGKTTFPFVQEGVQEFTKRIQRYQSFDLQCIADVKSSKKQSSTITKQEEAKKLLALIKSDDLLILLDEKGRSYRSIEFSKMLEKWMLLSKKRVIFLIGGAWGFDDLLKDRADYVISMSDMTFSHQLIRLIFLEQLYRAFTIIKNEKYHNE